MEQDYFGVPLYDNARRRVQKRKLATPAVEEYSRHNVSKKARVYVPEDVQTFLTPDDVVEKDWSGRMQCDDCKKWTVELVEDGAYSAYTCKDCGLVSTMAVLDQGYVAGSELTSQEFMDKRALKSNLIGAGAFVYTEKDAQLEHRAWLTRDSPHPEAKEEHKQIKEHLRKRRRERKKEIRRINIDMKSVIEEVTKLIGFDTNCHIIQRANEICSEYIKDRAPTDTIRYPLACGAVARAGFERGYGLRAWDFTSFLEDHVEDSTSLRGATVVFSDWRRKLASHFQWPVMDRKEQIKAYVATFTNRAVVKGKEVDGLERAKIASLTRWMGEAKLNRLTVDENKQRNIINDDRRKLTCLPLFLQCLPTPAQSEDSSRVKPMKTYLKREAKSKDECIRAWSIAATIIYIALSVRTKNKLTQTHIQNITGIKPHVLIACKKTVFDAIQSAMDQITMV